MSSKSNLAAAYDDVCRGELSRAREAFAKVEKLRGPVNADAVLDPLNDLLAIIDRGMNQAGLYSAVHPDPSVREVSDRCEQDFQKIITQVSLSRPLFDALSAVDTSGDDPATQRYVKKLLRDYRRAGVDKDEPTRERIRALNEELVKIGQEFAKNIREDQRTLRFVPSQLEGLPADYIASHRVGDDGKVAITTEYPDYYPFMTYAKDDAARLELYKEFRRRGHPKNVAVLDTLLRKRYELARTLGYEDWADYVTEDKMIKSEEAAREFIEKVRVVAKTRVERDYQTLLARLKKDDAKATQVGDWQKSYLEEKVKQEQYQFDSQLLRQYFTYPKVRDGLLALTSRLFEIEYRRIAAPDWHPQVEAFEVVDHGEVIGRFYLDMHPRADKYPHAAAFPVVTGVLGRQVPIATLVCNFPAEGPMEHDQVETFFHEFGHLIHHLLGGKHRWLGVSGFSTELDFVEAPSQIFEEWAWNPETLRGFATNEKGEVIPDHLIASMNKAREFGKGLWVSHQMFYAAVSLNYYDKDPAGLDTTAMMKNLQHEYSPFDYVEDTYFQLSFGHLDGYSAAYYSYMWALVIAKEMFSVFEKQGLLNVDVARKYREAILAPGGSVDAMDMVRNFLGREYTFDAFAAWLSRG